MTPDQINIIRTIIREELKSLIKSDRYTFERHVQFLEGRNIQFGTSAGTKIGTAATQKLAFYGATPVIKQPAVSAPSGGATQDTEARGAIGNLIGTLQNYGLLP